MFCSVLVIFFTGIYLVISVLYLLFTGEENLADTILILAGAVTTISVVYLAEQIRVSREHEKVKNSNDYLNCYNSESFLKTTETSLLFINDTTKSSDEKMKILEDNTDSNNRKTKSHLMLYFNFFEGMAVLYNKDFLNKEIIASFFKSISTNAYSKGNDFINHIRQSKPTNFKEWETMNKDIEKRKIKGE